MRPNATIDENGRVDDNGYWINKAEKEMNQIEEKESINYLIKAHREQLEECKKQREQVKKMLPKLRERLARLKSLQEKLERNGIVEL